MKLKSILLVALVPLFVQAVCENEETTGEKLKCLMDITSGVIAKNNDLETKIINLKNENNISKSKIKELEGKNYPLFYKSALKKEKDINNITDKELIFNKKKDETSIKITYTNNFTIWTGRGSCKWKIKIIDINNSEINCDSSNPIFSLYRENAGNYRRVSTFIGICENLYKGKYTLKIDKSNATTCSTGWRTKWTLQAQEFDKGKVD